MSNLTCVKALARAVYAKRHTVLLDDTFSALVRSSVYYLEKVANNLSRMQTHRLQYSLTSWVQVAS